MPHFAAGDLKLPPTSVPIPIMDPPAPMREPSPPDDPPGHRDGLWGLDVTPKIGFEHV